MKSDDFLTLYKIEDTHWWFAGMREITAVLLNNEIRDISKIQVLDAGCGTGMMLGRLKRYSKGGTIYGIDSSKEALEFCRLRGHKRLIHGDIRRLPFVSNSFQLITCLDVLPQLPINNDREALSELYRILAPGGLLYLRVPANQWLWSGHDRAFGTYHRYSLRELEAKLTTAGFTISRSTYANTLLFPIAVLIRFYKKINSRNTGSDAILMPKVLTWLNNILTLALKIEAWYLREPYRRFPQGLSVVCLANK